MTDTNDTHCRELAAELALGVATGRERADAIAHLQTCPGCRAEVDGLTRVHDRLRALIPSMEPPLGFESRVIDRIGSPQPKPQRGRRLLAAAAVAVALVGGGWGLATTITPTPAAPVGAGERSLMFAPLVADGHEVGQAFAYAGTPSWIYMYMEAAEPGGTVSCTVLHRDGTRTAVGTFRVRGHDVFWGGPVPIDRSTLVAVQVSDATTGRVLATAEFTTSTAR